MPADADFYALELLLDDQDRTLLHRVRAFMAKEVQPIINHYWTRARFPHELLPGLAELHIAGLPYAGYGCPGKSPLLDGMVAMELARTDPSIATFMGVHGGLAMGSIYLCGSEEQKRRWLPAMARMELLGAFGLTDPRSAPAPPAAWPPPPAATATPGCWRGTRSGSATPASPT